MSIFLLASCLVVPYTGEVAPSPAAESVSFAVLEERVDALIAEATEADRRDRLMALRELMVAMRAQDVSSQRRVYTYLAAALDIESRARPTAIAPQPTDPIVVPIAEETLDQGPTVDVAARVTAARTALAANRHLDALSALEGVPAAEAQSLRREAVDGWAKAERERAGALFLKARDLEHGPARTAALQEVRAALSAINERFPDNSYAQQVADHVARVDAELR